MPGGMAPLIIFHVTMLLPGGGGSGNQKKTPEYKTPDNGIQTFGHETFSHNIILCRNVALSLCDQMSCSQIDVL